MNKEDKKTDLLVQEEGAKKGGKILNGVVVSDKMQNTVVVAVTRFVKHPKYRKFIKSMKKYHVHSPENNVKIGDKVQIKECKPISKTKKFIVVQGVK